MTLTTLQIQAIAEQAVQTVFQEQFGIEVLLSSHQRASSAGPGARVIGSVGLAGELRAVVCLHISEKFASELSAAMFGLEPSLVDEAEVNDSIGEITNWITGEVRRRLHECTGLSCSMALPTIARGELLHIDTVSGATWACAAFEKESERFFVEVCFPEQSI